MWLGFFGKVGSSCRKLVSNNLLHVKLTSSLHDSDLVSKFGGRSEHGPRLKQSWPSKRSSRGLQHPGASRAHTTCIAMRYDTSRSCVNPLNTTAPHSLAYMARPNRQLYTYPPASLLTHFHFPSRVLCVQREDLVPASRAKPLDTASTAEYTQLGLCLPIR